MPDPKPCSQEQLRDLADRVSANVATLSALTERVMALDKLMDAKFVTYRALIDSQAEKVSLALDAADKAVTKSEMAMEKRFDSVNEFRGTLADQATSLVSRTEFSARVDSLSEKTVDLTDRINRAEGKGAGIGAVWGWIVGAAGVVSAIVVAVISIAK